MKSTPAEIERILSALRDTSDCLEKLAAQHTAEQLAFAPDTKTWSAQEVLAHLRGCADVWGFTIYAMLAEQTPELPDINERKCAKVARYASVPFDEALPAFSLQRQSLLRVLQVLPPGDWERDALITGRRHTVFTQSRRLAKHEAEHCLQLQAMLKT